MWINLVMKGIFAQFQILKGIFGPFSFFKSLAWIFKKLRQQRVQKTSHKLVKWLCKWK